MLGYLILLFTLVPIVELAILIRIGQFIGVFNTITLVLVTGVAGAFLARSQGLAVFQKIQEDLQEGIMPAEKLLDGLMILCGGILLLTPGLVTDAIGLFALMPFGRGLIKLWLKKKIGRAIQEGRAMTFTTFKRF